MHNYPGDDFVRQMETLYIQEVNINYNNKTYCFCVTGYIVVVLWVSDAVYVYSISITGEGVLPGLAGVAVH